jgi:hypothetical protein
MGVLCELSLWDAINNPALVAAVTRLANAPDELASSVRKRADPAQGASGSRLAILPIYANTGL